MPRAVWLLVIGMAVNVTGSSFLWPLNAIYIHDHLGKSLSVAGIVLMLNSAASVIGNLFGGYLFDKIGGYKSIILGIGISLLSVSGLIFWNGWPAYVVLLTILGFGSGIVFPSMFAMAGTVWRQGGRRAFNAIYVAQNLGVAVGAALGGFVASYSFQFIFIANALMYLIFLFIAGFSYRNMQVVGERKISKVKEKAEKGHHNKLVALLVLCIGYLLCWVAYVQWQSTIASYTQEIGISLRQYSFLWTINGALIVLGQPILNSFINSMNKSIKSLMVVGMGIFILSFLTASFANGFSGFLISMIILTIGEMLVWPSVPTIADKLAPKGKSGLFQGIVNSTATGGRMIGPLLGGMLVDWYGMSILFIFSTALIVVSIFTTIIYDHRIKDIGALIKKAS
ncbi:MDR family MFS transporter [Bacillus massilinigeriensis]|uniref:MDR family MFS transporter n=1 Tax=Bacillus massilionigeriensis TaxID=1805475 RepID=UPI00096B4771|nr:MFS transporter [Bacillus massilionigeriensis]